MRTKAIEEYEKYASPLVTYDLEIDPMFVRKHNPEANRLFAPGDYIILADTDFVATNTPIRIKSIERDVLNPEHYTLKFEDINVVKKAARPACCQR